MAQKKPFQIGDPLQIQRRCNATTTGACATKSSQDSRSSQSRGTVDHEKTSKAWKGRVEKKTCLISLFCLVRNGDSNTFGFGLKGSIGHSLIGIYDRVWLLAPVQGDNLSLVFLITYHPSYQWV